jgi:hypothetical protein
MGKGLTMKRLSLAILLSAAGVGNAAAANDLVWVFDHDESAGYAGVVSAAEKSNPEPHYSFLITCSQEDDWALYISDLDVKALGDTIAKNQQPSFTITSTKAGKADTSQPYYPDISFNQEEAHWEYTTMWDIGMLDHLVGVEQVAVKGTGLDLRLPTEAMQDSLGKLKGFCASLNSSNDSGNAQPKGAP